MFVDNAPAVAASVAMPAAIPFSHAAVSSDSANMSGMLVAAALLALAFAVLWVLKQRGWGIKSSAISANAIHQPEDFQVMQRLRLSPTCMAFVLSDGETRMLLVESRHSVTLQPLQTVEIPLRNTLSAVSDFGQST
ncbi:hypothetical protein [Dyella silvatica]|uniref:hypothetical protein n=1 Tax=Dyella silvatica TaxID=2992128 RepID=UPI002256D2D9|nr:hypothetical protein [Dyella silvatica]